MGNNRLDSQLDYFGQLNRELINTADRLREEMKRFRVERAMQKVKRMQIFYQKPEEERSRIRESQRTCPCPDLTCRGCIPPEQRLVDPILPGPCDEPEDWETQEDARAISTPRHVMFNVETGESLRREMNQWNRDRGMEQVRRMQTWIQRPVEERSRIRESQRTCPCPDLTCHGCIPPEQRFVDPILPEPYEQPESNWQLICPPGPPEDDEADDDLGILDIETRFEMDEEFLVTPPLGVEGALPCRVEGEPDVDVFAEESLGCLNLDDMEDSMLTYESIEEHWDDLQFRVRQPNIDEMVENELRAALSGRLRSLPGDRYALMDEDFKRQYAPPQQRTRQRRRIARPGTSSSQAGPSRVACEGQIPVSRPPSRPEPVANIPCPGSSTSTLCPPQPGSRASRIPQRGNAQTREGPLLLPPRTTTGIQRPSAAAPRRQIPRGVQQPQPGPARRPRSGECPRRSLNQPMPSRLAAAGARTTRSYTPADVDAMLVQGNCPPASGSTRNPRNSLTRRPSRTNQQARPRRC